MISWLTQDELILWEYHLDNPNMCAKPNIFQHAQLPQPLYSGEMLHHMCDSGQSQMFPSVIPLVT